MQTVSKRVVPRVHLRYWVLLIAALFCLAPGTPRAFAQGARRNDRGLKGTAGKQEEARKQLQHLEEVMRSLADKIEEKQPDEAKKLRETWKKAREKLLLEDMETIRKYLLEGQPIPAAKRADKVVQNLLELLNYLIGKHFESKETDKELEELKRRIEEISELEEKQEELLDKTSAISKTARRIKEIDHAMGEIDKLTGKQKKLIENPAREGQDADSRTQENLKQAQAALEELLKEQKDLHKTTRNALAKGRHAQMPRLANRQENLGNFSSELQKNLEKASEGTKGALQEDLEKATEEMQKAARAMDKASKQLAGRMGQPAQRTQQEAIKNLQQAGKALSSARQSLARTMQNKTPGQKAADNQKELAKQAQELAGKLGKMSESSPKGQQSKTAQAQKNVQNASGSMKQAGQQFKKGSANSQQAKGSQQKALKELAKAKEALEEEKKRELERLQREKLQQLAREQDELKDRTQDVARKIQSSPRSSPQHTSAGRQLRKAQQNMQGAQKQLSQQEPGGAQKDQEKALDNIRRAKKELQQREAQLRNRRQYQELVQMEQELKNVLKAQKKINERTVELNAGRKPGESLGRPERIELREMSRTQGKLEKKSAQFAQKLKEERSYVYGGVLDNIASDMKDVAQLLFDAQTDKYTQILEGGIETRLQDLIEALKREQIARKKQQQGGGGQPMGGKRPLIPPIAEIKMLRKMETDIKEETREIHKAVKRSGNKPNLIQKKILNRLTHRQAKVREMTEKMWEALKQAMRDAQQQPGPGLPK